MSSPNMDFNEIDTHTIAKIIDEAHKEIDKRARSYDIYGSILRPMTKKWKAIRYCSAWGSGQFVITKHGLGMYNNTGMSPSVKNYLFSIGRTFDFCSNSLDLARCKKDTTMLTNKASINLRW